MKFSKGSGRWKLLQWLFIFPGAFLLFIILFLEEPHELLTRILAGSAFLLSGFVLARLLLGQKKLDAVLKKKEGLKEANRELENFIYKATHDLRGPLSSIIGLISISKTDIEDEKASNYMAMIESAARQLDTTLSGLMQSIRIKDAKDFNEPIDLPVLLEEIKERLKFKEGFDGILIQTQIEPGITFVSNKLIISSLVQNFMDNAIKYRDERKKERYLRINIQKDGDRLRMIFSDNGIGIARELQEKIFDMYYRATENSSGSGLGLYLVKAGVDKLGGKISVQSEPGMGSTFTVEIPMN
ncbi:MAG TPA: HAMP domain-containing sensor histidine kinase [Bacteroidia bacterium]|jgi:signal transduction histidine kinase